VNGALISPRGFSLSTVTPGNGDIFWGDIVSCTSDGSSVVFQGQTTTVSPGVLTLFAPTVLVAWQTTDVSRWNHATATSSPTAPLSLPTSEPKAGLSTGAKVGISVGCVVAVLVAIVAFLLFRRRKSKKRQLVAEDMPDADKKGQLSPKNSNQHAELADRVALQELSSQGQLSEADHTNVRAELM
jgi:hypothetical protein